jgi:hypothetical protein
MEKIKVTINGKAYPCRQTMGAMLRFKQETGKEVTEIDGGLSDMCTFLWCCVVSACKADGVEFGMSLLDFADSLTPEEMEDWSKSVSSVSEESETGDEKKRK